MKFLISHNALLAIIIYMIVLYLVSYLVKRWNTSVVMEETSLTRKDAEECDLGMIEAFVQTIAFIVATIALAVSLWFILR